jgi:hypothetical protein
MDIGTEKLTTRKASPEQVKQVKQFKLKRK